MSSDGKERPAPGSGAGGSGKGHRTRSRILRAAIDRFGDAPFRNVSVSQIARDCDLTPAAVYAYFDSKADLFDNALHEDANGWTSAAFSAAEDRDRPITAVFGHLIIGLPEHPLVSRVLKSGSTDQLRSLLGNDSIRRLTDSIEEGVVQRQAAGFAVGQSARELAVGTETIVFSLLTTIVRVGLEGDAERVRGVQAVFDAAFGPPGTVPSAPTGSQD